MSEGKLITRRMLILGGNFKRALTAIWTVTAGK